MNKDEMILKKDMFKLELAINSLKNIHDTCDIIIDKAEKEIESSFYDYTDITTATKAKNILYEATLKIKDLANR